MQSIDQEGKTLEEALEKAINTLKCKKEDVEYEVLDEGSKGILGIGSRPVIVRVRLKQDVSVKEEEKELKVTQEIENQKSLSKLNDNKKEENLSTTDNDEFEKVKNIISKFCNDLSLDLKNIYFTTENVTIKVNLETDDASLLIGKHGKTLEALQYLINQIMHEEKAKFILDVSDYKIKQNEKLTNLIKSIAEKVSTTKRKVTLNPMNSSDRKLVHEIIKEYKDLTTKSIGKEPNRKVIIQHKEAFSVRKNNNYKRKPLEKNTRNFKRPNKFYKKRVTENPSEKQEQA
ncbi:MAG: RNA-binding protein Jag [Candidatus Sericytochromatia bacterium]|nr:MAG: RNA-binding protein Jag [Candidatus Sericytochromatia bacterium]